MSLFTEWTKLAQTDMPDKELKEFWTTYYEIEQNAYAKILENKTTNLKGSIKDLAKEYNYEETILFAGFIDGINTSLVTSLTEEQLNAIEEDSEIDITIDYEKLYYNMLDAKAEWLYNLEQWDGILPIEKRKEITKQFRKDGMVINEVKIGRNDPCTCGSGKKYKKCCGNK